jgi:RNA polymerase sigma-70 factor, ECF subfamily
VVTAFLAATRTGNFAALLDVLDPDAEVRADSTAVAMGALQVRGAEAVVNSVVGRSRGARLALVDGVPGAVWIQKGKLRVVFAFTVSGGRVTAIDLAADPARIAEVDVELLETT